MSGGPTAWTGDGGRHRAGAVRALRLTIVKEKVIREILSSGAAASGCPQDWQDMVATETSGPTPSALPGHVSLPFEPTSQLRLCVFRVPADRQGTREIAGTFDSGLLLPEQRREVIVRTLASMPPTQECSGPADRFAVLRAADNTGGEIYVELDHCRRILTRPMSGPPTLAQADRTLIGLLGR